ncbi:MAG: hypothetical protein RBR20_14615 [Desulfobacterales bacterium]|nr:hypothetical protein [Desulfobacteraceae bacterium]MDY0313346.1 hypothetical protein [Desulfobacterales bacterium]
MDSSVMMPLSPYQIQQRDALLMVRRYLEQEGPAEREALCARIGDYLDYRRRLDRFLEDHFHHLCNVTCYQSALSACCAREAIITFFAEVVVNALVSSPMDLDRMMARLSQPYEGSKCVYLGPEGCLWRVRPIVCALFLCDRAEREVLAPAPDLQRRWQSLRDEAQRFRWPDRPVLFDELEQRFMAAGCRSPLMYCSTSPGLLNVKRRAAAGRQSS